MKEIHYLLAFENEHSIYKDLRKIKTSLIKAQVKCYSFSRLKGFLVTVNLSLS